MTLLRQPAADPRREQRKKRQIPWVQDQRGRSE